MKAIQTHKGFTGIIPDQETYVKYLEGKADFRPHIKRQLINVTIPVDVFEYLVELDRSTSKPVEIDMDCENLAKVFTREGK